MLESPARMGLHAAASQENGERAHVCLRGQCRAMPFYVGIFLGISNCLLVYTAFCAELPQAPSVCAELSVHSVCSVSTVS